MRKNMVRWGTSATMLLTALPLGLVINAQGASFDCDKALTEVEKTICTKPELSILDEDLDRAYKEAQKKAQDSAALKEQQRNWLKERDLCKDASCLHEKYRQRIAALNQVVTGFPTIFPADVSEFDIDCAKAKSFAEKLICKQAGSPQEQSWIAEDDKKMRPELQWTLMRSKDRESILAAHRKWQKEVRDVCTDARSCSWAYSNRSDELRATWERPGQCYVLKPFSSRDLLVVDDDGNVRSIEPVCQAMEENLNQFCNKPPMLCRLLIAPRFKKQITLPVWSPLDPEANRALIEEFIRAPWEGGYNPNAPKEIWEGTRPEIEAAFAARRLTLSQGQLDIYNLGKTQLAYRLDYGTCESGNPNLAEGEQGRIQIESTKKTIDIQQAPEVIRQLFKKYDPIGSSTVRETFLHGGQTYTYFMVNGEINNELYITRHERWITPAGRPDTKVCLSAHDICKFEYLAPNKDKTK